MDTINARQDGDAVPEFSLSAEERAAALALDHKAAVMALEEENQAVTAVISEFILHYAEAAGERLKAGGDYFELLTPGPDTPALEALAMELVREGFEDELAGEDA